jgi:hypothetical protein
MDGSSSSCCKQLPGQARCSVRSGSGSLDALGGPLGGPGEEEGVEGGTEFEPWGVLVPSTPPRSPPPILRAALASDLGGSSSKAAWVPNASPRCLSLMHGAWVHGGVPSLSGVPAEWVRW